MKKKVKNCTIAELKKWYFDSYGVLPKQIKIDYEFVGFVSPYALHTHNVECYLEIDEEIEVEEDEEE